MAASVGVEQLKTERHGESWRIQWLLTNRGAEAIELSSGWLPHSGFRAAEEHFEPPLRLNPRQCAIWETDVAWDGSLVENGFMLLREASGTVYIRFRVPAGGAPQAQIASVT